jgi:hypothetical protein
MDTRTAPTPAAVPPRPVFDRKAWERAVLDSDIRRDLRLVAFALAHHADPFGEIAPGGPQEVGRLARQTHVAGKQVRLGLNDLEQAGFIRRPNIHSWRRHNVVRPITLTFPAARSSQPPNPGGAGER